MQHCKDHRVLFHLTIFLMLTGSLAMLGCNDDEIDLGSFREATAQDFSTNTFSFSGTFFDARLTNQRVTLEFGAAENNTVSFTMLFSSVPTTVITGMGIVGSIQLRVDDILVQGEPVNSTSIGEVVFEVDTIPYTLDVEVRSDEGFIEFKFTNPQTGETLFLTNF